jgi:DNA-binding MarR family transcriptional regulator
MSSETSKAIQQTADKLHSAALHLLRRLRNTDVDAGLSAPRLSILSVLVFAGDRTLGELARMEQVRPPTMTRLIQSLQAQGFVRRAAKPGDKRATLVQATAKGRARLDQARQSRVSNLAHAMKTLERDEIRILAQAALIMEKISRPADRA